MTAVEVLDMGLDCHMCDDKLKRERGCEGKGIVPFMLQGETHYRCPMKVVSSTSWQYIKAYALYKNGILPNGHGWLNESEKYIDAMLMLDVEFAKAEQDRIERIKKHGKLSRA